MAIRLMWYSVILPIEQIEDFEGLLTRYDESIGTGAWYDSTLFAGSAMSLPDARTWLEELSSEFCAEADANGPRPCIADAMDGPVQDCDWLDFDLKRCVARRPGDMYNEVIGNELIDQDAPAGSKAVRLQGRVEGSGGFHAGYVVVSSLKSGINVRRDGSFEGWVSSSFAEASAAAGTRQPFRLVELGRPTGNEYSFSFTAGHDLKLHLNWEGSYLDVQYVPVSLRDRR